MFVFEGKPTKLLQNVYGYVYDPIVSEKHYISVIQECLKDIQVQLLINNIVKDQKLNKTTAVLAVARRRRLSIRHSYL